MTQRRGLSANFGEQRSLGIKREEAAVAAVIATYQEDLAHCKEALRTIAGGRHDNGRPLGAELSRQVARKALTDLGVGWKD